MTDFDAQIAEAKAEVAAAREEYDRARSDFLDAAAEAIPIWWEEAVKRSVSEHPERAKALGKEGIGSLKRELADLQGRARAVIDEHLASDPSWDVTDEDSSSSGSETYVRVPFEVRKNAPPKQLDDALRKSFGAVASMIVEAGLATGEDWPRKAISRSTPPSYPYALPSWDRDLFAGVREQMTRCATAYKTIVVADRRRVRLEREKAQSEAADLWENA